MSGKRKTTRIVLRLDAFGASTPALHAIAQMASAMEAELAARMVEDSRLFAALAYGAQASAPLDHQVPDAARHAERRMRRLFEGIVAQTDLAWSFDVVQCAGVIAAECALHADDILALALPEIERAMDVLRDEILNGLARTSGVLLMPHAQPERNRPVVGMITDDAGLSRTVASCAEFSASLRLPLSFVVVGESDLYARVRASAASHWGEAGAVALHAVPTAQLDILAAHVRSLRPKLVVWAPPASRLEELLARPRLLREIGAPILLLGMESPSDKAA
jgi:hypothetical protein